MNWKSPQLWIAFVSLIAVFTIALVDIEQTSPGPLATVHQRDPDLAGSNSCSQCHGSWGEGMANACLDCHDSIGSQIEESDGLHGMLEGAQAFACARCHSDHHGETFGMVNDRSFALAGIADVDAFDHELIGFRMDGKHLELDCSECHTASNQAILPLGEQRYLGLDQSCSTCHDDPHEGAMSTSCAQCHGQQSFDELAFYDHERFLPLTGGHAASSCRDCHAQDTSHSLERLGSTQKRPASRDCTSCHESPHDAPFVSAVAQIENRAEGGSCVVCHVSDHVDFRAALPTTPEQHATTGFALALPHADVSCAGCHDPDLTHFADRYPGRRADDCASCHADPHAGQFLEGLTDAKDCRSCHDRHRFEPHTFGLDDHTLTAMPLTGSHSGAECNACHGDFTTGGARLFRGTPDACAQCHADAHRGYFVPATDDCATCHGTTNFRGLIGEGFEHEQWTGFAILGAHAQSDCESCHARSAAPDAAGRTFGFVAEHFGDYKNCATCHSSPHGDTFSGQHLPSSVDGRESCARCHVETSFRSFPEPFDHGRWTGWGLTGAHVRASCSTCHAPQRPDAEGRTWGRAAGRSCADCHSDVHARQFQRGGRTSCERCHNSTQTFYDLDFDHNVDSRFRLDAGHVVQPCSACHKPWPLPSGGTTVRYRPLDTDCADCHGASEEQLRKRTGDSR